MKESTLRYKYIKRKFALVSNYIDIKIFVFKCALNKFIY